MTTRKFLARATVATALVVTGAASAAATNLVALTGDRTLLTIDSSPAVVRRVNVSGLDSQLLGIDVRPFDGKLYGLLANGKVVTINPRTGVAAPQVTLILATPLPTGQRFSVDFNPAVDRMRIVSSGGAAAVNLAANVVDGTVGVGTAPVFPTPVSPATTNALGGVTPSVIGVAYTNSKAGAKGTLLFDIEDSTDAIYLQQPPGVGATLPNVGGPLGITLGQIGFDIQTSRNGVNRAFLINGTRLYNPGLLSGIAGTGTRIGSLRSSDPVRDLAVLPTR